MDLHNPGIKPRSPKLQADSLKLSHKGSPRILECVPYPFSSGSSQPRNQTRVSCIAGGFFTSWATREASSSLGMLKFLFLSLHTTGWVPFLTASSHPFACDRALSPVAQRDGTAQGTRLWSKPGFKSSSACLVLGWLKSHLAALSSDSSYIKSESQHSHQSFAYKMLTTCVAEIQTCVEGCRSASFSIRPPWFYPHLLL